MLHRYAPPAWRGVLLHIDDNFSKEVYPPGFVSILSFGGAFMSEHKGKPMKKGYIAAMVLSAAALWITGFAYFRSMEQVQEAYECWVLLAGRSLNREEKERLVLLGESLTVLGECGDPEAPDFLCLREGTYFLAEYRSLEDLLRESPGKPALEETSYTVFLDRVLRALELSRLEWLEMEQEEQTEDE